MNPWPHQSAGLSELCDLIEQGDTRICLTSPTGGGKTLMMGHLIPWAAERGCKVSLYTHRSMLLEQTAERLASFGISFGVRAAGYEPDLFADVQLSSIQTEDARTLKASKWNLHEANLVLIDEAHANKAGVTQELIDAHINQGAAVVGFTATPIEIGHIYDTLVQAGTNKQLRECGAHVLAHTYAPDEPDARNLKRIKTGEFSSESNRKAIMTPTIFGRVFPHAQKLNPDMYGILLFAPGVPESLGFAEESTRRGIPAAHIDGEKIWINGDTMPATKENRDLLRKMSESGDISMVCNRFVLREGIDWPHIRHGIFATCFGSLTAFLQSGGRLLRSAPGKDHCIVQDHGGNWWRHGSLNSDREWHLTDTERKLREERAEKMRNKKPGEIDPEPITCPKCMKVRLWGQQCPACGFTSIGKSRMVIQLDGSLRRMKGDIYKPHRVDDRPEALKNWERCYYRAKNSRRGMTFNQARALYANENGYKYPAENLPLMPKDKTDWYLPVASVPWDRLNH